MLAGRYRVLSYDKRGHGLSDAVSGPYRLDDHLDDLFGLTDFLGFGDFALVGVSVGGTDRAGSGCPPRWPHTRAWFFAIRPQKLVLPVSGTIGSTR